MISTGTSRASAVAVAIEVSRQQKERRQQIEQLHQALRHQPGIAAAAAPIPCVATLAPAMSDESRWRAGSAGPGRWRHRRRRAQARRSAARRNGSRHPARSRRPQRRRSEPANCPSPHRAGSHTDAVAARSMADHRIRLEKARRGTGCPNDRIATNCTPITKLAPITAATICATSRVRLGPIARNSATVSMTESATAAIAIADDDAIGGEPVRAAEPGEHVDGRRRQCQRHRRDAQRHRARCARRTAAPPRPATTRSDRDRRGHRTPASPPPSPATASATNRAPTCRRSSPACVCREGDGQIRRARPASDTRARA